MNERSSRAHSVVVLNLTQKHKKTGIELSSRLYLADLGGSEQVMLIAYAAPSYASTEDLASGQKVEGIWRTYERGDIYQSRSLRAWQVCRCSE